MKNSEKGFTHDELKNFIRSAYSVSDEHIEQFIQEELDFPLGSTYSRTAKGGYWIPPLELVSKVTDYDELKEARQSSKNAFQFSIIAIIISSVSLYVTIQLGENQIEVSQEQFRLQQAVWDYEKIRNERMEQRDIDWRREDLRFYNRLP
ncbi:MAG: hypothetical protein HY457_01120 [Parcubacteria group bacterium]|nr:hypothetical protein [Parcubacteria group bacterium]